MDLKEIGIEEREVDGTTYEFYLLSTSEAFNCLSFLINLAKEPVAKVLTNQISKSLSSPQAKIPQDSFDLPSKEDIESSIISLLGRFEDPKTLEFLKKIVSTVKRSGKKIDFDNYFKGRLFHLVKLASEAVRFNFADFLDEILESLNTGQSRINSTQEKQTLTGEYGESSTPDMRN